MRVKDKPLKKDEKYEAFNTKVSKKSNGSEEGALIDKIVTLSSANSRSMIAVIDSLSLRGSFKGEELSSIGQIRNQCITLTECIEEYQSGMIQ